MLFRDGSRFWIQRVIQPIVVLIGVVGNIVTILVLTRRRMTSSTNTYLTALAFTDLVYLVCMYALSFENHPDLKSVDYLWYWNQWKYFLWIVDCTMGISVWLTAAFTFERYIAVCHPLRGRVFCTEARARRVIIVIYILCLLSTCTTPFEWSIEVKDGMVCKKMTELAMDQTYKNYLYWFWAAMFVFVPLVIIAIFNTFLIEAVHRSKRQRSGLTQQIEPRDCANSSRQRQENKITTTLIAVVILFIVCQTPAAIMLVVYIFYSPDKSTPAGAIMLGLGNIFNFLTTVNASSNFLLYCVMSDKYRRTLVLTLCPCLATRHQRSHTFTSYYASHHNSSVRFNSPNALNT
ncbi:FMRFamide receptor-like isoform X3 [Macrosteles quadrilineatus]|uniref:FMRFamide receptor-like isoform X3 n=1 Tax=Macrosteles quadrilineatus TaxID=74068 RepID=UPI0023E214AF|nr:FMRFamide receptor-like isoform X3 [Macrosteles quadrilineatus]